ncbi:lantibiotic dehydratase C-terminal domain-containing protein [Kitasatospora sp. NPDC088391]|uniref:lantibiotic dehydratase C-terminal domain-containing protein n=1 Tax=Kitasatospora sp. NPDC088391 TaxID=3364074 RepID=UPI0038114E19
MTADAHTAPGTAPSADPSADPPSGPTAGWQSWHLHLGAFGTDVTDLALARAVAPVVARHTAGPDGGRPWFFLRYWQGGPHLRLRIHGPDEDEAREIGLLLARGVAEADAATPAERRLTDRQYADAVGGLARTGEGVGPLDPGALRPPGVVRARYEPETERYGGPDRLALSERLFHLSSRVALGACLTPRSPQQVFGQNLAATAVAASALPETEVRSFLESVRDGWSSWADAYAKGAGPARPPGPAAGSTGGASGTGNAGSKGSTGSTDGDDRLDALADRLRSAAPELLRLIREPGEPWSGWADPLRSAVPVWSTAPGGRPRAHGILGSHLHMTANRLGGSAGQEGRTAALLLRLVGAELP